MTDSAFRPLTAAEKIFKSLVWDPMIKAGEVWIEGTVPFLALPVIKTLDEFAIEQLTDALYNQMVVFVDVTTLRLVDQAHNNAYQKASEELAVILNEQGQDSDAFKKAQDEALAEMAQFTHLHGAG